jgi:hypothetical protein
MKSFNAADKDVAKKLYGVLTAHLMAWMGSVQGIQRVSREALMHALNIGDVELDAGVRVIKEWSAAKDIPSVTALVSRGEEQDKIPIVHDVIRSIGSYRELGVALPSDYENLPIVIDPVTHDWVIPLVPTPNSGVYFKAGRGEQILRGQDRRTDLMDLPGYFSMFL